MQNVCDVVSFTLYRLTQATFVSPLTQNTKTYVLVFSLTHCFSCLQSYSLICLLYSPNKHLQLGAQKTLCLIKVHLKSVMWRNYWWSKYRRKKIPWELMGPANYTILSYQAVCTLSKGSKVLLCPDILLPEKKTN